MTLEGYISNRDGVPRTGETVDALLNKIEDLTNATHRVDGTMSSGDKTKLDELEDDEELSIAEIAAILNI